MNINELPADIQNKILKNVKLLRQPKKVLYIELKQDIESLQWLNDILLCMQNIYGSNAL